MLNKALINEQDFEFRFIIESLPHSILDEALSSPAFQIFPLTPQDVEYEQRAGAEPRVPQFNLQGIPRFLTPLQWERTLIGW